MNSRALWRKRVGNALQGDPARFRVPSVKGANPDSEGEIERPLARGEFEVLDGDLTDAHEAGVDLSDGLLLGLGDTLGGAVDHADVPVTDATCDGPGGDTGASADFKYP